MFTLPYLALAVACFIAGITNTIAGGGSFFAFPALLLTGLDPRAANITCTLALFPMQLTTGYANRKTAGGTDQLSLKMMIIISLIGGGVGGALLLLTPPIVFARLVPWFILFATAIFAYSTFQQKRPSKTALSHTMGKRGSIISQICISIYGGYFGGGIGFLMLAALTMAGMSIRKAGATKSILAGIINTSAVIIFLFSNDIGWRQVAVGVVTAVLGGVVGVRLLHKTDERILRIAVIVIGVGLTIAMFIYAPQ